MLIKKHSITLPNIDMYKDSYKKYIVALPNFGTKGIVVRVLYSLLVYLYINETPANNSVICEKQTN